MFRVFAVAAFACVVPCVSSAQVVLTMEEVIARARAQSPGMAVGSARVAEAEAVAAGAGRRQQGVVIEGAAGPRRSAGSTVTDIDLGFSHTFERAGQRRARTDAADARVLRAVADADALARDEVRHAAEAFVRAVAAAERLRLAQDAEMSGRALLAAMERRFAAGDVAAMDVNLARIDAARATATVRTARAAQQAALGDLRVVLRLEDRAIEVRGTLDVAPLPPASQLREGAAGRPEFAVLDTEALAFDAEVRLARAGARPDIGLRVGYEREEGDTILLGGLTVTLPPFRAAASAVSVASAQASRARVERDVMRQAAVARAESSAATHAWRADAAAGLAAEALPALADNDSLAQRSYEAGELSLMDLLRIRRDAMETRLAMLDLRLDAALSRLDVDFLSGALR